jgi:seryl-tRNA synthetase
MLDMKYIRENPESVRKMLKNRGLKFDLDGLLERDSNWRGLIDEGNRLKHERNELATEISNISDPDEKQKAIGKTKETAERIKEIDEEQRTLKEEIDTLRLNIPNMPLPNVPIGADESDNKRIREVGEVKDLGFETKTYIELAETLGLIDLERGAKISGSGFYVLKGLGAMFERALIGFMLDLHIGRGYTEVLPPFLVNSKSMTGTGQLPKFEFDMYKITEDDLFLNPTAEVPVTNLHRDEILSNDQLPINYCSYTACFRREHGRHSDERGIIRVHQFNKVELVKFALPERSAEELENLTKDAEEVLKQLELPYKVLELCTGDLGFSSAKTYDIEVYSPGQNKYLEVSSCSNFLDFQARRAAIKYRPEPHLPSEFVHTLNGSGLALSRTMVAILENYQQEDGTILIPEVLKPYMGNREKIGPA